MGLTSSRGKRPARLHSSMMGTRLSSINFRVVSRTRRSSSLSSESKSIKSTPLNLMADMESLSLCGHDLGMPTTDGIVAGQTFEANRGGEVGQTGCGIG